MPSEPHGRAARSGVQRLSARSFFTASCSCERRVIRSSSSPSVVPYPHVERDARGVPILAGTTMKVVELVMAQRAHGWSPEELSFQFPHLSMSQIHSALAYYWDHRDELEADIEKRSAKATSLREDSEQSPLGQRLAALKHRR